MYDKNHQSTPHDLLDVPIRPIISSKAKSIKDSFNRLTKIFGPYFLQDLRIQLVLLLTRELGLFF